nr:hypothetical protein [Tanacetum cinerariifolium]
MDKSKFCLLKLLKRFWQEREKERKARTTLLMAIPEDHLVKLHKMTDAKEIWEAIKSRFEGLHKGYDRFQSLLSQLETHGAGVSTEDSNQKFLRSLPSFWSKVSLITRTKPREDTLSFDDLYNNIRVFESDVKGSNGSSSSTQNVAFVSSNNTNSTNEVNTAFGVSTSSGHNSQKEGSTSYTDDLMYSFFANQSSGPQLDHEDLEQVDEFDLEEMDLKWQVAMIFIRLKKFYKKTRRKLHFDAKELVCFDKSKVECFNCHNTRYFVRECRSKGNQDSRRRYAENTRYKERDNGKRSAKHDEHKAMVTIDREGVDWTGHAETKTEDYALMVFNSSNSGSDTESTTSESDAKTSNLDSCDSSSSKETLETVPAPVKSKPKVVNKPKVWSDAPIIEEYESDSDDEYVSKASVEQEKPSCAFVNTIEHVKTLRQTAKEQNTLLTKTGRFPVNAARQNFSSQTALTRTVRKVNTARPKVNEIRPRHNVYKSHLPIRRLFNRTTTPKANIPQHKVNTAGDKSDNPHQTLKGKGIIDSGCSRHMTGNKAYFVDSQDFNGGPVAFGGSKGQTTGKDTECLVLSHDFKLPDEN